MLEEYVLSNDLDGEVATNGNSSLKLNNHLHIVETLMKCPYISGDFPKHYSFHLEGLDSSHFLTLIEFEHEWYYGEHKIPVMNPLFIHTMGICSTRVYCVDNEFLSVCEHYSNINGPESLSKVYLEGSESPLGDQINVSAIRGFTFPNFDPGPQTIGLFDDRKPNFTVPCLDFNLREGTLLDYSSIQGFFEGLVLSIRSVILQAYYAREKTPENSDLSPDPSNLPDSPPDSPSSRSTLRLIK